MISHLNGRDRTEGSTLYLVAGDTGQVIKSLALDLASDQSTPFVEPLIEQQVILSGENDLLLVDMSADPPSVTRVMPDIFDLEIEYPIEVSSAGWYANQQGYDLVIRLNHPRNNALYWYHSLDHHVEIVDNNLPTLTLLPDNQLWDMSPWEDQPAYRDEYEVIALETGETNNIQFPGHVPCAGGDGYTPNLIVAPDGTAFIAAKSYGALYWMHPGRLLDAGYSSPPGRSCRRHDTPHPSCVIFHMPVLPQFVQ